MFMVVVRAETNSKVACSGAKTLARTFWMLKNGNVLNLLKCLTIKRYVSYK